MVGGGGVVAAEVADEGVVVAEIGMVVVAAETAVDAALHRSLPAMDAAAVAAAAEIEIETAVHLQSSHFAVQT